MRCTVVGHVEWVEFARVPRMPAAGEIVHAERVWEEPAGGGAVVARQLALLAGGCTFQTALGDDTLGHASAERLGALGIDLRVEWRDDSPTRRAWTHVDAAGERTITVLGDKLLADGPLDVARADLVFFVSGTVAALRAARAARFVAATVRELGTLKAAGVPIDLLVASANDRGEQYDGSLQTRHVALTNGAAGGTLDGVPYSADDPGTIVDTYGAGDSFAAALAFALARGDPPEEAVVLAAAAGASVIRGAGPYERQLACRS
ncbi:MAG TPA: PfkB family carbohydrate kinase [Gaiellaceae bacterium]|nr:PfkB family carbohydrate kinase [Gaiellaceae bacterium]